MYELWTGFLTGLSETVRGYWAPAVALWRLLVSKTDSLIAKQ